MKKLTKKDRRRFEAACKIIRKHLHLEHLEREYRFTRPEANSIASTKIYSQGWRLLIYIRPSFWSLSPEKQLLALIHEHVHVALHPYHQAFDHVESRWVPSHSLSQVQEKNHVAGEIAVDHLTSVFYDLLKDRL